jgi:hypothetical protein
MHRQGLTSSKNKDSNVPGASCPDSSNRPTTIASALGSSGGCAIAKVRAQCSSAHSDQAALQLARACAQTLSFFSGNFGEGFWNTPSADGGARSWGLREVSVQVKWLTWYPATSAMRCRHWPLPPLQATLSHCRRFEGDILGLVPSKN